MARALIRKVRRARAAPALRMGQISRMKPLSRGYGWDRGTPIDRHYIERFLASHAGDIRGRVLEIAASTRCRTDHGSGYLSAVRRRMEEVAVLAVHRRGRGAAARRRVRARKLEVNGFGNLFAATAFLHGAAVEEVNTAKLEQVDTDYPITICARAVA